MNIFKKNKKIVLTKEDLEIIINKAKDYEDLSYIDISRLTDLSYLFFKKNCTQNISNWNTSNITNMKSLFRNSTFNSLNLNKWDVSKVTNMESMFYRSKFNSLNLNKWNIGNVKDMDFMFYKSSFNSNDILFWNINKTTKLNKFYKNINNFKDFYNKKLVKHNISFFKYYIN